MSGIINDLLNKERGLTPVDLIEDEPAWKYRVNPEVSFKDNNGDCKNCDTPLRPDRKCQFRGCKLFGKVQ